MIKYELNKRGEVTKNGHTMFIKDIVTDLNRGAYLEDRMKDLDNIDEPRMTVDEAKVMDVDKLIKHAHFGHAKANIKSSKSKFDNHILGFVGWSMIWVCVLTLTHGLELPTCRLVISILLLSIYVFDIIVVELWYKKNIIPKLLKKQDEALDASKAKREKEIYGDHQRDLERLELLDDKLRDVKMSQGSYYKDEYINTPHGLSYPMGNVIPSHLVVSWEEEREQLLKKLYKEE